MFYFKCENISYEGFTLILPSVSVGNVGQLCVDLCISSLKCTKVGYIWHPSIIPIVGCHPFHNSLQSLMVSSEIYEDSVNKLLFLQIRSPLSKKLVQDFLIKLLEWVECNKISKVIILTGSTYTAGKTELIEGEKLRYLFTPNLEKYYSNNVCLLNWTPVTKSLSTENTTDGVKKLLPGSGFAYTFYEMCLRREIKAAILVKFCSEGDNIPDAYNLADYLNQLINVIQSGSDGKKDWINPLSWKFFFGKSVPKIIY